MDLKTISLDLIANRVRQGRSLFTSYQFRGKQYTVATPRLADGTYTISIETAWNEESRIYAYWDSAGGRTTVGVFPEKVTDNDLYDFRDFISVIKLLNLYHSYNWMLQALLSCIRTSKKK